MQHSPENIFCVVLSVSNLARYVLRYYGLYLPYILLALLRIAPCPPQAYFADWLVPGYQMAEFYDISEADFDELDRIYEFSKDTLQAMSVRVPRKPIAIVT